VYLLRHDVNSGVWEVRAQVPGRGQYS
jgi:hypothetical protein